MKEFATLLNAHSLNADTIPVLDTDVWRKWVIDTCKKSDARIVSLFGKKTGNKLQLFAVLGLDIKGELLVSSTFVSEKYLSIAQELTEAHLFERELYEELGILPEGHPWLKPVREGIKKYNYYSVAGDDVHEVAVGPVHAGVIEPGHFRFQCHGEKVFNLEIHLGYQKRGVEKLMMKTAFGKRLALAESIAGDTVIGHALAYCHALEGLADRQVTQRARIIRGIAIELERVANHIGDLGALANDVGFLPAASYFGALRAEFLNLLMLVSGNRFGRSLIKPGGVAFDIDEQMAGEIKSRLAKAMASATDYIDLLLSDKAVLERFHKTGSVKTEVAKELGLVGVAARACNLQRDVRVQYPIGIYRSNKIMSVKVASGDVYARARVRSLEVKRSIEYINELISALLELVRHPRESGDPVRHQLDSRLRGNDLLIPIEKFNPNTFTVSMVEGWRGEIVHVAMSDAAGNLAYYKIVDPSFHNWSGLEMALRDGQISDFPLCNKSFNLSYAGFDL